MASTPDPLASPDRGTVLAGLARLLERHRDHDGGRLASYIPELARADPALFAIAVVRVDGTRYEVGDADARFTIQSISKPFTHAIALQDRGRADVLRRVGVEPSGDAFDSIIALDAANRPHNPMVNAGAIAVTGMIDGRDPTHRLDRMLGAFEAFMGRRPGIDMPVFTSERTHGHRNRAMAHLMLNFALIDRPVEEVLDLYFQQCSIVVDAADLALMAATLANAGVNPVTGVRAMPREHIRDVLTVMHTCGMYNYAGEWAYTVGLPAKSGVSGGIIAVVPGQFGIAVYSPRVDERGNSVRGIRVCEDLSANSGMHIFEARTGTDDVLTNLDAIETDLPSAPEPPRHTGDATVHRRTTPTGDISSN